MYDGPIVFAQVMDFLPDYEFRKAVSRCGGQYKVRNFSCRDQFFCMAFAQLPHRESLRDIERCLRAAGARLYHMGIRGHPMPSEHPAGLFLPGQGVPRLASARTAILGSILVTEKQRLRSPVKRLVQLVRQRASPI